MNFIFRHDTLQESIIILNKMISSKTFLIGLCNKSNNNPNTVIDNLTKIISYYLILQPKKMIPIDEILSSRYSNFSPNLCYIPSNSYQKEIISLYGFNSNRIPYIKELRGLYRDLDIPYTPTEQTIVNDSLKDSIIQAFTEPRFLYNRVIEDVCSSPIRVGDSITDYYEQILLLKKMNIKLFSQNESTKKVLDYYLAKRPMLIAIYYRESKLVYPTQPFFLKDKYYIDLPFKYEIIQTCAENLNIPKKTFINDDCTIFNQREIIDSELSFSRFERLTIDENFKYANSTLTGNPFRDINIIYGSEDYHNSKSVLFNTFEDNLQSIQKHSDINLFECNGIYHIQNGRHRIVYLKYHFESTNILPGQSYLRETISIPAYVSHFYGNYEFRTELKELLKLIPNLKINKVNNYNDDSRIILSIDNNHYLIQNIDELKQFILNYKNGVTLKPLVSTKEKTLTQTNDILVSIYNSIGLKIFTMDFIDIIEYLRIYPYAIDKKIYQLEDIDIDKLLQSFKVLQDYYAKSIIYKDTNLQIEKAFTDLIKYTKLSKKILIILQSHPEYLDISNDKLILELKKYDDFKDLQDYEIKRALEKTNINEYHISLLFKQKRLKHDIL